MGRYLRGLQGDGQGGQWQGPPTSFVPRAMPPVPFGPPNLTQAPPGAVRAPTQRGEPPGEYRPELSVMGQLPPWQEAPFWAKPLDEFFPCAGGIQWYDTWTTVMLLETPETWMHVIQAVGYQFGPPDIPIYDIFEVACWRDSQELCRWEDMRIAGPAVPAANPAEQYVFGGPRYMLPTPFVIDRNQTLAIRVRVRGPEVGGVFAKTSADPLGVGLTMSVRGWRAPRLDMRDGAHQTGDVFSLPQSPDLGRQTPESDQSRFILPRSMVNAPVRRSDAERVG